MTGIHTPPEAAPSSSPSERSGGDSVTPHNENPGGEQSSPSAEVSKRDRGIYEKFVVRRTDRTDEIGSKHFGCEYFVLDLTHDKHAPAAIIAYAESCKDEYPLLAQDLKASLLSGPGVGTNAPASTTGDFGAVPASSSVPSGDSVTLIERLRAWVPDAMFTEDLPVLLRDAANHIAVLELKESDRQSSSGGFKWTDGLPLKEANTALMRINGGLRGRESGEDDHWCAVEGCKQAPTFYAFESDEFVCDAHIYYGADNPWLSEYVPRDLIVSAIADLSHPKPSVDSALALLREAIDPTSTTSAERSPSPESSRPVSTDEEEGRDV